MSASMSHQFFVTAKQSERDPKGIEPNGSLRYFVTEPTSGSF